MHQIRIFYRNAFWTNGCWSLERRSSVLLSKTYACGVAGCRSPGSSPMCSVDITDGLALLPAARRCCFWKLWFPGGFQHLVHTVLFLVGIFVCSQTGSHPYEDVTKSGYKLYMKYKSSIILLFFGYTMKIKYTNLALFSFLFFHFWILKTFHFISFSSFKSLNSLLATFHKVLVSIYFKGNFFKS